jgi:hypothetical protein
MGTEILGIEFIEIPLYFIKIGLEHLIFLSYNTYEPG